MTTPPRAVTPLTACDFVPPHEPWTCRVHQGVRTNIDEQQCDIARPAEPFNSAYLDNIRQAIAEGKNPASRYIVRRLLATLDARLDAPDFMAADRALAVAHRDDDQPCGCDECMSYGAEDEGFDWYKVAPARRIVLRALDSGDDRLAPIATAFREHEEHIDDPE